MQVLVVKKRGELDQLDDDGEFGRRSIWKMLAQILKNRLVTQNNLCCRTQYNINDETFPLEMEV